jgi:hypothetical protein
MGQDRVCAKNFAGLSEIISNASLSAHIHTSYLTEFAYSSDPQVHVSVRT